MTSFGRTAAQDILWDELNAIRVVVGAGLLDPTQGEYTGTDPSLEDLQDDWNDLVEDYTDIHNDNDTVG